MFRFRATHRVISNTTAALNRRLLPLTTQQVVTTRTSSCVGQLQMMTRNIYHYCNNLQTAPPSSLSSPYDHYFSISSNSSNNFKRTFATTSLTEKEIAKRLDDFQELFVEARLCIEDANDSIGTTYYEEDCQAATEAVEEAVDAFTNLIEEIDDEVEKNRILRSNGLKVEQLKGELEMALQSLHDH